MIANAKLRFGLVGAGAIAQAYGEAFRSAEHAQLVAVTDVRADAAQSYAETFDCEAYASHEELAERGGVDAVIVCTPPSTHPDVCIDLLERGIHVVCEKPLAIDSASARRMVDAAERAGVRLTMGSKFRYVDDVARAKSIVTSGILGEIVLFENAFTAHVDMSNRWNSNPKISGGGVLIDNGTHSIDIIRYFLGPIAELQVVEGRRVQNLPVEDTVRVFVRSESGVMGSVDLSWSINKELPTYISIYGSEGTVLIGWKESKYRRSSDDEWIVFGSGYNKTQAFRSQIDNFARAIRGHEGLVITHDDALASVEVIEAAYASLRSDNWQRVESRRAGVPDRAVLPSGHANADMEPVA